MMSYEVTMGLSLMGAFLIYGTLEPNAMVVAQGSNPLNWGIVTQPLGFIPSSSPPPSPRPSAPLRSSRRRA